MLFTNKTLEVIKLDEKRVVEMVNVYGHNDTLPVDDSVNEKVTYVKDGVVHKYLDIKDGALVSTKNNKITMVLDSLEYKCFKCNGRFEVAANDKDKFTKEGEIKYKNRTETRTYGIDLVSIDKDEKIAVGKLTMTSGLTFFLIKNDNDLVLLTHRAAIRYIDDNKLGIILKDIEFVQL